jgi:hypothetical protein
MTHNLSREKTGFRICLSSTQPAALQRGVRVGGLRDLRVVGLSAR